MSSKRPHRSLSVQLLFTLVTSFAVALALLLNPTSAFANIFGKDDRVRVKPLAGEPLATIGHLTNKKDFGRGTAFLVSRCFILTNFHVAFSNEETPQMDDESVFQLGDEPPVSARVVTFGQPLKNGVWTNADDWALLKLETCLGDKYKWMPLNPITPTIGFGAPSVQLAGFPNDRSTEFLTLDPDCRIRDLNWRHDCATRAGNSGGPIMQKRADGSLEVIGLVASEKGGFSEIISSYVEGFSNGALPVAGFIDRIRDLVTADQVAP